ncbi:MAG: T9SS type A sorting domain-containing protein [Bacteroidetes bacterium]|nr:T9SS type A sorting domain-containing protein [Bacteroidota bacterium]
MKQIFLNLSVGFLGICAFSVQGQTQATNFDLTDCSGKSCKLFDVLDSGHVVVMCWVMPCGNCTGGATKSFNAAKAAQGNANHKVYYFLIDDYGNSACSTVTSWGGSNGVTMTASYVRAFSNAGNAINMTNYGTAGMPKAAVIAGASHKVYYNVNGSSSINTTAMTDSINKAIAEMNAAGVGISLATEKTVLAPNPVSSEFRLTSAVPVEWITIKDISGKEIMTVVLDGLQIVDVGFLNAGVYFVQCFSPGHEVETIKIIKN